MGPGQIDNKASVFKKGINPDSAGQGLNITYELEILYNLDFKNLV